MFEVEKTMSFFLAMFSEWDYRRGDEHDSKGKTESHTGLVYCKGKQVQ